MRKFQLVYIHHYYYYCVYITIRTMAQITDDVDATSVLIKLHQ